MTDTGPTNKEIPQIIKLVNENDLSGVKQILLDGSAKIEDVDDTGMSPLQHACYKGQLEMVQFLLEYGADVNADNHSHKYSCLHFAAISGNIEAVKVVLSAGAKPYHTNSLSRTASQMAAFVGNHRLVAVINNFIHKSSIVYYTKSQGLETDSKLPSEVASPLHDLIMQPNLHPVFIAIFVRKVPVFLIADNLDKTSLVLSLLCKKEAKKAENINEILCLKLHFLGHVLSSLSAELKKESKDEDSIYFAALLKKWLTVRSSDRFQVHLDTFVRNSLKDFPFIEMPLFVQLCRSFSTQNNHNCAVDVLNNAINGIRESVDNYCATCDSQNDECKKCSKCKFVHYCDSVCQRLHWHTHKKECKDSLKTFEERQEKKKKEDDQFEADNLMQKLQGITLENRST